MTQTFSPPGARPVRREDTADGQAAYVRALCDHHAAALVVMACVLIEDVEMASDLVAATLAAACRDERRMSPADPATRARLARSVYHRCLGRQAAMERFPQLRALHNRQEAAEPFGHLSGRQCALLALALFGGHDVAQIARTLGMPTAAIVDQLPRALLSVMPALQ